MRTNRSAGTRRWRAPAWRPAGLWRGVSGPSATVDRHWPRHPRATALRWYASGGESAPSGAAEEPPQTAAGKPSRGAPDRNSRPATTRADSRGDGAGVGAPGIRVLSVDDNPHVGDALRIKLSREPGIVWDGWLPSADALMEYAAGRCPQVVLLDLDMPGKDPFEALFELTSRCPQTRVVVFSGHVRRDLIQKATDAGAWGYVSKGDGDRALVHAIHQVAGGEFALSDEVRMMLGQ